MLETSFKNLTLKNLGCPKNGYVSDSCNAAIHRYCQTKNYVTGFGPVEHSADIALVACTNSVTMFGTVPFTGAGSLNEQHSGCTVSNPVSDSCNAAIHRYCQTKTPPPSGTIKLQATLDSSAWSGVIEGKFDAAGYGSFGPYNWAVPLTAPGLPLTTYTFYYVSGGPSGADFQGVTPSATQTLTEGGTITFSYDFVTNHPPTVTMNSPPNDITIETGQSVTFASTASDPDGDPLTFDWVITTISGTCPNIPDVEDPGAITFNNAATCDVKVTVSDGKGGTASSATVRITVGGGGG